MYIIVREITQLFSSWFGTIFLNKWVGFRQERKLETIQGAIKEVKHNANMGSCLEVFGEISGAETNFSY